MTRFSYGDAAASVKLMATAFLLFAVLGFGVVGLQIYATTGLTAGGALAHYRGDEATFQTPMGFAQLVEITHAHAYTMPMLALVLSFAFVLTEASERLKVAVVVCLAVGVGLELALPWAVRYGPSWSVHGFNRVGVLLGTGLLLAVVVPLREMWGGRGTP